MSGAGEHYNSQMINVHASFFFSFVLSANRSISTGGLTRSTALGRRRVSFISIICLSNIVHRRPIITRAQAVHFITTYNTALYPSD